MPRYLVTVAMTFHKDVTIYADDEDEAEEKAEELVAGWNNVESVEVLEVTAED